VSKPSTARDIHTSEALWRFSLAFYARPGVSEALIALQDRCGYDVNLMLFCLWHGVSGRSRVTDEQLVIADQIVHPIRAAIVEPLRALRRQLRSDPDPDVQRLRQGIQALELTAEKIVQKRLASLAGPPGSDADLIPRETAAQANLALYLGPEVTGSPEAAAIREALAAFVRG
jgi:uncharacterized protein (TIGR02444 family)